MKLELQKFDMSSIADDKVIMLIGKRDTGKSFLVRDLLYHKQDIPVGTVISPTEEANTFFGHMVPPAFIHDDYDPGIIENVIKRQRKLMPRFRAGEAIDPRAFLVMDDCLYDTAWSRDINIRSAFLNGRHYKLLYVVTSQYPLGLPPILRSNIDYTFILRDPYLRSRKLIYENYAGMFPNFKAFSEAMNACTNDFNCLVIHNTARSNRIEDQVFWYKAENRPDFRMGSREFWDKEKQAKYAKEKRANITSSAMRGRNVVIDVERV